MKLLEGYVENRTLEAALAAMLGALCVVGRSIKVPIYGVCMMDFGTTFWVVSILVLSYPYVWMFSILLSLTSTIPTPAMLVFLFALNTAYFIRRIAGLKSKWVIPLLPYAVTLGDIIFLLYGLKLLPFEVYIGPALFQATLGVIQVIIMVPIIMTSLEKFGVVAEW